MSDTQQAFQIIFDEGVKTFAAVDKQPGRTSIHCELTHLNPGANLSYMTETGERVSCSVISDAKVVSIAKEAAADDAPLTLRVTLKRALKNDCSPLPQKGEMLTLLPENGKSAIRTTCAKTDEIKGTFAVTYRFPHIRQGAEAWLVAQDGNRSRVAIRDVDVHCFNSGINQSICVLHVSEAGKTDPLPEPASDKRDGEQIEDGDSADKPDEEKTPQDPSTSDDSMNPVVNIPPNPVPRNLGEAQGGDDSSGGGDQSFDSIVDGNTAIKPPFFSVSSKGKSVMQLAVACLATAVFVLILVPAGAGTAGKYTIPATTRVQSSVAASDSSAPPNTLASVMVWGATERETIPMNHENLHKFFGQSDPARLTGSLTGEVLPGRLGIYCKNTPVFDEADKTSDVSGCVIAMPDDAKPGAYKLTPENSATWFHQPDPSCFRETLTPYPTADTSDGLHVNLESCDWIFDPVRKCFDYSECTFTVPRFNAE